MLTILHTLAVVIQGAANGFSFTLGSLAAKELAKLKGWFPNAMDQKETLPIVVTDDNEPEEEV
jgi:hypothetical protein